MKNIVSGCDDKSVRSWQVQVADTHHVDELHELFQTMSYLQPNLVTSDYLIRLFSKFEHIIIDNQCGSEFVTNGSKCTFIKNARRIKNGSDN